MQDGSYPPISLSPRAANFRLSKVRSAWWIACTVCVLIGLRGLTIFEKPGKGSASGPMAEWLRRGLQILARRFDSGSGLHPFQESPKSRESWSGYPFSEIGLSNF